MVTIYEVSEDFERGALGGAATPGNTIFTPITSNGSAGTVVFTEGRSGLGVSRTDSSGFGMLGCALPGMTFSGPPPTTTSSKIADPLGGTLVTSVWIKIGPQTGLGLSLFYLETANVTAWETDVGDTYNDYEGVNIATAPSYDGFGGKPGDNIWIIQRPPEFTGNEDLFPTIDTYWSVPLDVWAKYEISYREDGTSRVTIGTDDTLFVDTGWTAGPSGWRPNVAWLRTRSRITATAGSRYVLDDFNLRIDAEAPPIAGRPDNVRRRFT